MSYSSLEASIFGSRPFYLYEFTRGSTVYRYTSRDRAVTFDGNSFAPLRGVKHGPVPGGGSSEEDRFEIELPRGATLAQLLIGAGEAPLRTSLILRRTHEGLSDAEAQVEYRGRVAVARPERRRVTLVCTSDASDADRLALVPISARACPWVLYGQGCGLTQSAFEAAGTATAVSGLVVTVTEAALQADGYYLGGVLRYGTEQGFVRSHVGTALTLISPVEGLAAEIASSGSATVAIAPGCDRSITTCDTKFSNADNFGGAPYAPARSPYGKAIS